MSEIKKVFAKGAMPRKYSRSLGWLRGRRDEREDEIEKEWER